MPRRLICLLLAVAPLLTGCSTDSARRATLPTPADVTAYQRETLYYLASDHLEGRGPGTRGLDLASRFIANEFRKAGLQPLPNAPDYFQSFTFFLGLAPDPTRTTLTLANTPLTLTDDFRPNTVTATSPKPFDADVVFVGYGIRSKQYDYDDYYSPNALIDVQGKVALILRYEPMTADGKSRFTGKEELSSEAGLSRKIRTAQERGATAVLLVNPPGKEDVLSPFAPRGARGGVTIPVVQISRATVDKALARQNLPSLEQLTAPLASTGKPSPRALPSLRAAGTLAFDPRSVPVRNVVGLLPGTGPHRDEYVIVGAHYDHLGYGGPGSLAINANAIHHGADDNASGTTAVLTLARELANQRNTDRSILFMTFTCEEQGLIGSEYYTQHPLVPLESTAYMLNLDMVGRLKGDTLLHGGEGTASTLEPILSTCIASSGLKSKSFGKGGFGPSDHASFAQKKIPVLFLFTGLHADYHRPTDTADKINYEGLRRVTDLAACLTRSLASAPRATYNSEADRTRQTISGPFSSDRSTTRPSDTAPSERVGLGLVPDMTPRDGEGGGMRIDAVTPGSAADKAGIRADDILLRLDDTPVDSVEDLQEVYDRHKPGDSATAIIQRGSQKLTFTVTFTRRRSPV